MKHTPVELLRDIADVHDADQPPLSRHARLKRWAEVLEREPRRRLKALEEIEAMPRAERHGHRVDGSPLAVAFSDSVLRACGLRGDRFGDALDFFGLTERQAHYLLCSCMNGRYMEAGRTAERIRRHADLSRWLPPACLALAGGLMAAPVLMVLFG